VDVITLSPKPQHVVTEIRGAVEALTLPAKHNTFTDHSTEYVLFD